MTKEPKKIAIVGTSPRTKMDAPYNDPTWELWGLNHAYLFMERIDRCFEIHDLTQTDESVRMNDEHREKLKALACPVYTQTEYDWLPNSTPYPLSDILQEFQTNYFNNSVAYMVALAIYENATEIAVYGVDMAARSEYGNQRPCCEYWLGLARGRGIKVYLPDASDLCKVGILYGFNIATSQRKLFKENRKLEMRTRIEGINKEQAELMRTFNECKEKTDTAMAQGEVQKALLTGCLEEMLYEETQG